MRAHEHRHAIDGAGLSAGLVIAPGARQMPRLLCAREPLLPRLPRLEPPLARGA